MTLFEDEEVNDDQKPTYAGHVVAVVERQAGQLFAGTLGILRPSSAATKEKQGQLWRSTDRAQTDLNLQTLNAASVMVSTFATTARIGLRSFGSSRSTSVSHL